MVRRMFFFFTPNTMAQNTQVAVAQASRLCLSYDTLKEHRRDACATQEGTRHPSGE